MYILRWVGLEGALRRTMAAHCTSRIVNGEADVDAVPFIVLAQSVRMYIA